MIEALRTPDAAFGELPGFAYEARYLDDLRGYEGLRVAYVDEGPPQARRVYLCLHGEPTWSFLYRKMLPVFVASGGRVVAPDFFGFGRSDKPVRDSDYSFGFHRDMLLRFVERLDLRSVTLVVQDWGGLLGLTLPPAMPERFDRAIVMNTTLATGDVEIGPGFLAWRSYADAHPDMDVAALMRRGAPLTDAEAAAYAAPFPDARYKAGVRAFPKLVATSPEMDGAAIARDARTWWQTAWSGRTFNATGVRDPVLGVPAARYLQSIIRDCPPPVEYPDAGHFLQEWGADVARDALRAFGEVTAA